MNAQAENESQEKQKFAGRELHDVLKSAREGHEGPVVKELLGKIGKIVEALKARAKLETVSPALRGFSTAIQTSRETLGNAAQGVIDAREKLFGLQATIARGAENLNEDEVATLVATQEAYEEAKSTLGSTRPDVSYDLVSGDGIDKGAISSWQKSKGGRELIAYARDNDLDVVAVTYTGLGEDGSDLIELTVDNTKRGRGKVHARAANAQELEAKNELRNQKQNGNGSDSPEKISQEAAI